MHTRDHYGRCHCDDCKAHRADVTRRYRQTNHARIYAQQKAWRAVNRRGGYS